MKRHPSLEPFSRDHNVGLVLARQMSLAVHEPEAARRKVSKTLIQCWDEEMEDHFRMEEELLIPVIPDGDSSERLLREHREFGAYVESARRTPLGDGDLSGAGSLLNDHIRWEERVLFPLIERTATEGQLADLASRTAEMESRRAGSAWSPRRGELMERRKKTDDPGVSNGD